jgi:hypothetical protein
MDAVCLLVAGIVRATLPAAEFTLAWEHSVQKTRWEERYRVEQNALMLVEARIQSSGAGMDPPAAARLRAGWWTWTPGTRVPELRLTESRFTRDYTLCWREGCRTLAAVVGPTADGTVVTVRPCTGPGGQRESP